MEKIYMESSNKKQKKKSFFKKFFNDKWSMTLTIVFAVVGIVGLTIFGFSQISFAADTTNTLPETFVSKIGSSQHKLIGVSNNGDGSTTNVMPFDGFYANDVDTGFPVFCVQYDVTYAENKTYTAGELVNDHGLVYLMSKTYPNVKFKDSSGTELSEDAQIWLTQAAVWTYLSETDVDKNDGFDELSGKVRNVYKLYGENADGSEREVINTGGTTLFQYFGINQLILTAKSINATMDDVLSVSVNSNNVSITNDNKFYQTDLISIVSKISDLPIINEFKGYSVSLSGAPEGTVLVDEEGRVYDDISNMSPTSKFFLRVPVDKVTDENKDLGVVIRGIFDMYGANYYSSGQYQKVVNVRQGNYIAELPLDIQLDYAADVPDTGMGVAQTIYFIGLIILLSGVGIVYANAKPATAK